MLEAYHRYCDRCGKRLTKENNKCHYEICDMCNKWLETYVKEQKARKINEHKSTDKSEPEI